MLSCVVNSRRHPGRSSPFRHCDEKPVMHRDFRPFLSYTSALFHFPYPLSPLLATHTKTAGCVPTIPILNPALTHLTLPPSSHCPLPTSCPFFSHSCALF